MAAKRGDWKVKPMPEAQEVIPVERTYTAAELATLKEGVIPREMEDKWFIYYEEPWLSFHRSWTGNGIFQVRFEEEEGAARVVEARVSRDPKQYRETNGQRDALLLACLLDGYAGRDTAGPWEAYMATFEKR